MKKSIGEIKLQIQPGKANPAPPIGPALGQKGLNIPEFCKQFNDRTKDMDKDMSVPVIITAYADRSFTFVLKSPPVSNLLRKYSSIPKGSSAPGRDFVGKISPGDVEKIAKIKLSDMGVDDVEAAKKMVMGTARSMGIEIDE